MSLMTPSYCIWDEVMGYPKAAFRLTYQFRVDQGDDARLTAVYMDYYCAKTCEVTLPTRPLVDPNFSRHETRFGVTLL